MCVEEEEEEGVGKKKLSSNPPALPFHCHLSCFHTPRSCRPRHPPPQTLAQPAIFFSKDGAALLAACPGATYLLHDRRAAPVPAPLRMAR